MIFNYCNNLLTVCLWPVSSRVFSIQQGKAVLLKHKSDPVTRYSKLSSFVPTPARIKWNALSTELHSALYPSNITSSFSSPCTLCSSYNSWLLDPVPSTWNALPPLIIMGPLIMKPSLIAFDKTDSIHPDFSLLQPKSPLWSLLLWILHNIITSVFCPLSVSHC